jgi:Secretion system C-terminal sorting domain
MLKKNLPLILLLLVSMPAFSQFPTTLGTRWEYFQYLEDMPQASAIYHCFQDEVIADTVVGAQTYLVVQRTGNRYWGYPNTPYFDNVAGHYYYRVVGNQVRVLDSVVSGQPTERLLYDFGVPIGDTLQETPVNIINLTDLHTPNTATGFWDLDSACAFSPFFCDSPFVHTSDPGMLPWRLPADSYMPLPSIYFRPGIGTLYSFPYISHLAVYGQHYYLGRMFENDQEVYTHPMILATVDRGLAPEFLQIFPNPATDRVSISSSFPLQEIRLMDGLGRMVLSQRLKGHIAEATLDVGDLPRGLYWLQANGKTQTETRTVMVR